MERKWKAERESENKEPRCSVEKTVVVKSIYHMLCNNTLFPELLEGQIRL